MRYADIKLIEGNIVLVTFSSRNPTEREFEEYLQEMLDIYLSRENLIFVFDSSRVKHLSHKFRVRQGEWMKENKEIIKCKCLRHIYVIHNPLVKFILQSIFFIQIPIIEYDIVSSIESANLIAQNLHDKMLVA